MSDLQGPEKALHITVDLGTEERAVTLIAHVLDEEARIKRDRELVKLAGDVSFDDLPTASRLRLWMRVTTKLSLKDCPRWLDERLGMHDELLFEVPDEEVEEARHIISNMYQASADYLGLSLNWSSLAMVGENYAECH